MKLQFFCTCSSFLSTILFSHDLPTVTGYRRNYAKQRRSQEFDLGGIRFNQSLQFQNVLNVPHVNKTVTDFRPFLFLCKLQCPLPLAAGTIRPDTPNLVSQHCFHADEKENKVALSITSQSIILVVYDSRNQKGTRWNACTSDKGVSTAHWLSGKKHVKSHASLQRPIRIRRIFRT